MKNDVIQKVPIGTLNFQDPFFNSLRDDYDGLMIGSIGNPMRKLTY